MRVKFLTALILFIQAPTAFADNDPLSLARAGYIACGTPRTNKTCLVFSKFEFLKDGTILETDEIAIAGPPLLTLKYPSQVVTTNANAVCTHIKEVVTVDTVTVKREGAVLTKEEARPLIQEILTNAARLTGKDICEIYGQDGNRSKTTYVIDGKPVIGPGMEYLWVKSEDGFKLSPF